MQLRETAVISKILHLPSRDPPISRSLLIPVGPELKGLQKKRACFLLCRPVNRDPQSISQSVSINHRASFNLLLLPTTPHYHQLTTCTYSPNRTVRHHHPQPRALLPAQTLSLPDTRSPACPPTPLRTSYPFIVYSGI